MFDSEVLKDPELFRRAVFLQAIQRDITPPQAKYCADRAVEMFEWNLNKESLSTESLQNDLELRRLGLEDESEFNGKLMGSYEGINFSLYPGSFSASGYPEWDIVIAGRSYGDSDQYGCCNLEQTVAKVHELIRTNHLNKE